MPRFDFSKVDQKDSFVSVPAGAYTCRVAEVRLGAARDGSERWSLRLDVVEGEHAGRMAAWDSLTWSERGVSRVKRVLGALGFDVTGELEVEPEDLKGLCARVQVFPEEWEDAVTGRRQERNIVPFSGWAPVEGSPRRILDDAPAGAGARASQPDAYQDTPF